MSTYYGRKFYKKNKPITSGVETKLLSPTIPNVSVKILKESSTTPMPNFNTMKDNDIKVSFLILKII